MTLDAQTLITYSVLLTTVFFFAQMLVWWCNREIVAMAYWAVGSLMVLSLYLIIAPLVNESESMLWPILGNITTTGSIFTMWAGVRVFAGKSAFYKPLITLLILHSTAAILLVMVVRPGLSYYGRVMFQSPMTVLLMSMTAWELFTLRRDLRDFVTRLVGLLFAFHTLFFVARFCVASYIAFTDDSAPATFMKSVTYLVTSLFLLLMNIGFLVMTTTRLQAQLQHQATTDSLTGLLNRRGFLDDAERHFIRSQRNGAPISVIVIDVDNFKKCNDNYGHLAGDKVLKSVATYLQEGVRSTDMVCRWGGEEFCGLLPDTPGSGAKIVLERLRTHIQTMRVLHEGHEISVTISVGIAQIKPDDKSLDDMISRADRALYAAKTQGRNRVYFEQPNELTGQMPAC